MNAMNPLDEQDTETLRRLLDAEENRLVDKAEEEDVEQEADALRRLRGGLTAIGIE